MHVSRCVSKQLWCSIVVCCSVAAATALEFPTSKFERCKYGDNVCMVKSLNQVLREQYEGMPEIGLASIDPLRFTDVHLSQGGNNPVTMDLSIPVGDILGWRKMVVEKIVGFEKDPKSSKFEIVAKVPLDIIKGKYTINGKLLVLPLQGTGDLEIKHNDLTMDVRLKTKVVTRDNEDYLEIRKVQLQLSCKSAHYELGNLFNSKEISDGLNTALNADSQLVFNATRKSFGDARSGIIQRYLAPVFAKVPYRMLFL